FLNGFDRAETKAVKAIQKHSMYIGGAEKNYQMDEAHLLLGKSRYYEQRFVPALEAFNYVLYKYPSSDKIYEVKIWREKTNMRLENDGLAVNNLRKLLKEIKFKDQIYADANAALAQAFLNLEEKDSAVAKLKIAIDFTKSNEEKSRYRYILGQIYEELGLVDSAFTAYRTVIDMKRKAGRQYVIHSHIRLANHFDYEKGDTLAFINKYNELLADRENRPYLDFLDHQMGVFYDKKQNYKEAKAFYNFSLRDKSRDEYLIASNYRNLATIYFNSAEYVTAGKYYDSTLVHLQPRTREHNLIRKKRENLEDVIKYEGIAHRNDSIIALYNMSGEDKKKFVDSYITELKKKEEAQKKQAEKEALIKENQALTGAGNPPGMVTPKGAAVSAGSSSFYFYNPTTVENGKKQFAKIWGKRSQQDFWRLPVKASGNIERKSPSETEADTTAVQKDKQQDEKYTADYYLKQIPESPVYMDSLVKERNFAYYQLGVIYKEKFKEYQLAVNKLEQLLKNQPEERLVLPAMYHLYKLYEILDKAKAEEMKSRILSEYPDSRYAQILGNPNGESVEAGEDSPVVAYDKLFREYQEGDMKAVLPKTEEAIERYNGDEIVPKFELLKANVIGKLKGLNEYKTALNYVALNYPNSEEGKEADKILTVNVPKLEALQLGKYPSVNWKILYQTKDFEDKNTKALRAKIAKFIKDRSLDKLFLSLDVYTMTDNFVVIHGMNTEDVAQAIVSILKDYKDYKVTDEATIISAENYAVVQIKKNFDEYLAGNIAETPVLPNWDGKIEKAPAPETGKPNPNQQRQQEKQEQQQVVPSVKGKRGFENMDPTKQLQEGGFGMPPTPQFPDQNRRK
ncbi:MAG: tetratricopeptide repeat protein, partial [Flavobacterium sp.]